MPKQNRKGHFEIEKMDGGFMYRTIASNGRQLGRQSEKVKTFASLMKSLVSENEIHNGSFPVKAKFINCNPTPKFKHQFQILT